MTEAHHFDIIILGSGNAGFGVSAMAAEAGKSIAFVEEYQFGGVCPNRGCTPKKVLMGAAKVLHEINLAADHHISVGAAKLDWAQLIARKQDMIGFLPDAMAGLAEKRGTVFRGQGTFTGPNTLSVGGQTISADHIVIATGSRNRPLPIPGADLMMTSMMIFYLILSA